MFLLYNLDTRTKKGLLFGGLGIIIVGFQPIVANARPQSLDAFIFAAMTCLVEAIMFFQFGAAKK